MFENAIFPILLCRNKTKIKGMANTRRPMFDAQILEGLCKTIADTNNGLTGSEIEHLLANARINDVDPANTKWRRLFNAFVGWQNSNQCSNAILIFIQQAMMPVRYIGKEELFHDRRLEVNKRLAFIGVELKENGKFTTVEAATTIAEAEQKANRLKHKLESRNTHVEIFNYCKSELLVENYFHAVFEATKSVADRLRKMTGLNTDGSTLADTVFSTNHPLVRINNMLTQTDRSEHLGLCYLIKGIFGMIRNSTAHEPKISFVITEEEALDSLTTISLIHKKLDKAI
ncbi:TIGR02391 family protein [Chryseobacterium culicis]|uniref:TIGR02391 family protein n=1 Tax=Chryseobacterium culicis TaxID=680127 RepID=A0A2S9CZ90_CHRCI|nr:TIGR02391 family protein [Chryseobacterium culicis]